MKSILIRKPDKVLKGVLQLPASKSISNRLLIIQALTGDVVGGGGRTIMNLSDAADTVLLKRLLEVIRARPATRKVVELDAENAGTVLRFLTAYLSLQPGKWVLTGSDRMKQRPIGILADALVSLGARIDCLARPGYPPLLISGGTLKGGEVFIDSGVSSQFTSALLMIGPLLPGGLTLRLTGNTVSAPYAGMTVRLMQQAGASVIQDPSGITVQPGNYIPGTSRVEADWSSAAFWYEAAVFAGEVDLELTGLRPDSLQGDAILAEIYRHFGIRTEFTGNGARLTKIPFHTDRFSFDFTNHPDIAQAVMATCAGLGIGGRFEGVNSLQIKETDRLRALQNEFGKMGIQVSLGGEQDVISAAEILQQTPHFREGIAFESYGDHRTAMVVAPFALLADSVRISNPEVVVKSYPDFWGHLSSLGFILE